jgi:hypothetical protein
MKPMQTASTIDRRSLRPRDDQLRGYNDFITKGLPHKTGETADAYSLRFRQFSPPLLAFAKH